jgi:LDH2 family malate/lactate/ureidoglycolate dehydrogenase
LDVLAGESLLRLTTERAVALAQCVLRALGAQEDVARTVAGSLVEADRCGHASHGMVKLVDYAARAARGALDAAATPCVRREHPVVVVDGRGGFGHPAARLLIGELVDRTQSVPVALGGIVDASHTGRLGEWAELAVAQGRVLLVCTATVGGANVAAFGAAEPRLGTNPLAIGIPGSGGDAFLLDMATSAIAGGKLAHLEATGVPLPLDGVVDGMLLCFGAHKGYGLSLAVSLLGGCLVAEAGTDRSKHGLLAVMIGPGAFADADVVRAAVRTQLERMRSTPARDGFERVEVPGDFERRNREQNGNSIGLADSAWEKIITVAASLGLPERALSAGTAAT